MPVVYASVLRGTGPFLTLAEHAAYSGNFAEVGTTFLDRAAAEGRLPEGGKFTFATNGYDFCYLRQGHLGEQLVHGQGAGSYGDMHRAYVWVARQRSYPGQLHTCTWAVTPRNELGRSTRGLIPTVRSAPYLPRAFP